MLSKKCQRHHSFLEPLKITDTKNRSSPGTLSPDTVTTTSSGYSTGGSSVSTTIVPSSREHQHHQQKLKSKSFHNFITKLKNYIISPKTKPIIPSATTTTQVSKGMSTANIFRPYTTSYNLPLSSSSIKTSNTIALPFAYYQNSPRKTFESNNKIKQSYITKSTTFDKISAWLDHTELNRHKEQDENDLFFIDDRQQQSISSSPMSMNQKLNMKKTLSNIRIPPKRSTSMVSTISRPIIEQKTVSSPTSSSSFSSSILARGMSEQMTPQKTYHLSRTNLTNESINNNNNNNNLESKSNRRRAIDFSRRRTVAGPTEQINNKENLPVHRQKQVYQFSPSTSINNFVSPKKYYFHSSPSSNKNEDILMNSYGLTLLQPQKRQSISTSITIPNLSENISSHKPINHRSSIHLPQHDYSSESLDDLLCDREVESYFYPNRRQSLNLNPQHTYINLETSPNHYQTTSAAYVHGTLC